MALALPRFAVIQSQKPPKNYLRYMRADEPNEDQSQWSCTLFEPIRRQLRGDLLRNIQMDDEEEEGNTNTIVIFRHVQLNDYLVYPEGSGGQIRARLIAQLKSLSNSCAVFHIIDWESLLMLPKHIALKGDNGRYLNARWIEGHQYLQFASCDNRNPAVANQVFVNNDGSVRIKNDHFGKFWRRSPNWIWADSDDTTTANLDTLFYPIKVGDNVVALRNLGNNKFCKRLTTEGKTDCLNAGVDTISKEARLVVEELVVSREIYNVNFHLLDARIYNQSIVTMVTKTATNDTQESNTATLKFLRNETKSSTWTGSVSFKLGVKTEIQTGIPFIVEGKVEVSAEFTGSYQWGETVTTENQVETEYTFSMPPMSKVTVSLLATQGSCDVPYSYTQRDTLMNGEQVIHNFDDGVYTGINSFNFFYQTK
ncbi:hypothetical protein RHMOL_Rhmol05G0011600 [Rhododendron molle]|uniref:Uncharacterized protein n=1 Tax=Rhododendron molle TaxID=49168 RepID=A0ACC0NKG0_RHOML|nr:hypothetical protein RHMOL_Rhmol05G0011600 [Rhododendron molle]